MRILLVSDLHYTLPHLDWVVRRQPAYDLVVIAGDSLDISSAVSLDVQSVVLLKYIHLLHAGGRVAISSGNHDLTGPDAAGEQCALWLSVARDAGIPTDRTALTIGDTLVSICPWWDGPLGRTALEQQLDRDVQCRPARWIWVYHWPPIGSPTCWNGRRPYGDTDLPQWIDRYKPDMVLTGHVHESAFKPAGNWGDRVGDTWIFNAGRQIGPVPAHVEIDTEAGTATWHSMMGDETVALSALQPPERTVF